MNDLKQKEFDETLKEGRLLRQQLHEAIAEKPNNDEKIRELKGKLAKKIEKLTHLDGKHRIGWGVTTENWDE